MALTAQSIVKNATLILQDTTSIRWTAYEIVDWINAAQREIMVYRPDANPMTGNGTLALGTRQTLVGMPGITNPIKLGDIKRNVAVTSTKQTVRMVEREILDVLPTGWHSLTPSINIVHFTFDEREPLVFYTYPPASALAQLEIMYYAYPTDVPQPSGIDYSGVTGNIGVTDIYGNAILDYILYRCYSKDSEYAGNVQRAGAHKAAFDSVMGIELKATIMNGPESNNPFNKNTFPKRS